MSFHFGIQMKGWVIFLSARHFYKSKSSSLCIVTPIIIPILQETIQKGRKRTDITGCAVAEFLCSRRKFYFGHVGFASHPLKPAVFAVESRPAEAPCGKTHRW